MAKTKQTSDPTPPKKNVPVRVIKPCIVGGMTLAPGAEFLATREKADELIAAGVVVEGLPRF